MEWFKKLREMYKNVIVNQNKKKLVENLVIIIIIGVIIIIAGGTLFKKEPLKNEGVRVQDNTDAAALGKNISSDDKLEIEKEIGDILSQIEGAGRVSIKITYVSGKESIPAYDTRKNESGTDEKDNGGGTRSIKQSDIENNVVYEESQGGLKKPVIVKELQPVVRGVVVVADGATDPSVKENLSRAVQILLDVPIHKVQVFTRGK